MADSYTTDVFPRTHILHMIEKHASTAACPMIAIVVKRGEDGRETLVAMCGPTENPESMEDAQFIADAFQEHANAS